MYESGIFNTVTGFGVYDIDTKRRAIFKSLLGDRSLFREISPAQQQTTYFYSYLKYPPDLTWTLGLSYDSFEESAIDSSDVNPKVGLEWNITDYLRVRLAAFRTIKPALVANQTIQPTQVAGFNQFFDDENGTKSWRYGFGVDAKIAANLYAGAEFSRRDLDDPEASTGNIEVSRRRSLSCLFLLDAVLGTGDWDGTAVRKVQQHSDRCRYHQHPFIHSLLRSVGLLRWNRGNSGYSGCNARKFTAA